MIDSTNFFSVISKKFSVRDRKKRDVEASTKWPLFTNTEI